MLNADVVYLDFSKAIDKVDHAIVLRKIKQLGINGKITTMAEVLPNREKTIGACEWRHF